MRKSGGTMFRVNGKSNKFQTATLGALLALCIAQASAQTVVYSTNQSLDTFGTLASSGTSTVTFEDPNLVTNWGAGNSFVEDFTFTAPTSEAGTTITGEELILSGAGFTFSNISGLKDDIYSGAPGSGTLLSSTWASTGSDNSIYITNLTSGGSYYLEVKGSIASGAVQAGYTGILTVASIPEPQQWALMVFGLGLLVVLLQVRGRGSQEPFCNQQPSLA